MRPCGGGPDQRRIAEIGAAASNALPASQGWPLSRGGVLQVAAGEVDAGRVAEHQAERGVPADVRAARPQRHHQLHLVVQVVGERRIGRVDAGQYERVGRLGEEERRIGIVAPAHLAPVRRVVAPDAEDAPHREQRRLADDRNGGLRRRDRRRSSACGEA